MLSRPQQILLKRAQREAGIDDAEYRDALKLIAGCSSSTDERMTDRHLDLVLAYFEAIHWRRVDAGDLQPSCNPDAVFKQRGYWARKNPRQETSRDRYTASAVSQEIARLETALAMHGLGAGYCATIRRNVTQGRGDAHALHCYKVALQRTLNAKERKISSGQLAR